MRLGRGRKSDVLRCRIELQLILDLWTSPKCDLNEIEKGMFQGLEWHSQLIFGLWTS